MVFEQLRKNTILARVVTIILILCSFQLNSAANSMVNGEEIESGADNMKNILVSYENFPDISGSPYKKAICFLDDIGVMTGSDDGNFNPDSTVTRAEFAVILTKMLGIDENAKTQTKAKYSDVPEDYWASGYIAAVSDLGIMSDMGIGMFAPEQPVKYEEVVKMLVCAAGYQIYATNKGGYPAGYLATATQQGITKSVTAAIGEPCKREVIAQLVRNTLEVDIMDRTGYGTNEKYEIISDKSLLSERLKIKKIQGIVEANDETALYEQSKTADGKLNIDGKPYLMESNRGKELLGLNVTAYVKELDNEDEIILSILADENKNEMTVVNAGDIDRGNTSLESFSYWGNKDKDNDPQKKNLNNSLYLIYNGAPTVQFTADDLMPDMGQVMLLDNNGDGKVDIIFVTAYIDYVVNSLAKYDHYIYLEDQQEPLVLDMNDHDKKISIMKAGKEIAMDAIKPHDVLSVAKSIDDSVIKVFISNQNLTGEVEELENSENDRYVSIEGQKYKLSPDFTQNLKVGDTVTLYFDYFENVADSEAVHSSSNKYAFLINAAKTSGLSKCVEFKILDEGGSIKILKSDEKIRFTNGIAQGQPGSLIDSNVDALNVLNDTNIIKDNVIIKQMIKYSVNNQGLIAELKLAQDGTNLNSEQRKDIYCKAFSAGSTGLPVRGNTPKMFMTKYVISNKTKVFLYNSASDDEKYLMVYGGDYLQQDSTYSNIVGYDVGEDNVISAVTIDSSLSPGQKSPVMIISRVATAVDANGDSVYNIYGFTDGKAVQLSGSPEVMNTTAADDPSTTADDWFDRNKNISQLAIGDVIQYITNADGTMNSFRMLYSVNPSVEKYKGFYEGRIPPFATTAQDKLNDLSASDTNDAFSVLYVAKTKVYKVNGTTMTVNAYGNYLEPAFFNLNRIFSIDKANIFLFNVQDKKITKASLADLSVNSEIFVRVYSNAAREIIIFKN